MDLTISLIKNSSEAICSRSERVQSANTIKFFVKQNETPFESIGFNMVEHYEKLIQNSPIDIVYVVGENKWNDGQKYIQLELKDIRLSKNYA